MNRRGFTLVELLIGTLLSVILLGIVFQVLSVSVNSWRAGIERTSYRQAARMAVGRITQELKYADQITYPAVGTKAQSIHFYKPADSGPRQRFGFQLGTTGGASTRTLYMTIDNGSPTPLTGNTVSNLEFLIVEQGLVQFQLSLDDGAGAGLETISTLVNCLNFGTQP